MTPIPTPEEIGSGWFSSTHLPLNMLIRRGFHHFKPEVAGRILTIGTFKEQLTENSIIIQAARTGCALNIDNKVETEFLFTKTSCLFHHSDATDILAKADTTTDLEVTVLIIPDSVLMEFLGEESALAMLSVLNIAKISSACTHKIPLHITSTLYSSLNGKLTGNIHKLYAQSKILEYICALAVYTQYDLNPLQSDKTSAILHLQEELMCLEGKIPTLDELGRRYGMSARVLNDEFRRKFGQSIFSFISENRLKEAHNALLESELPMKALASNLGYSHVNHFISAFSKKFGYSPGNLRKKSNLE